MENNASLSLSLVSLCVISNESTIFNSPMDKPLHSYVLTHHKGTREWKNPPNK